VELRTDNLAGNDVFVATPENVVSREICTGTLTFKK
jgi:hypothetical protein